jgi:hypothetical protein
MKITKTQMYIGIGIAVLGAYWYFKKNKKDDNSELRTSEDASDSDGMSFSIGVGPAKGNGAGNWLGVPKQSDRKLITGNLSVGTIAHYRGSPCTIKQMWKDSNGNMGAIRCEEIAMGDYNATKGETLSW